MRTFEKNLRAYFHAFEKDVAIFHILDEGLSAETYKFLTTYQPGRNRGITHSQFKAKVTAAAKAHLDKAEQSQVPIVDLLGQMVEIKVLVKHYNFKSNGANVSGWNMQVLEMHPF